MGYSTINKTKCGVCCICGGAEQDVVKIRKDLFCLQCNKRMKTEALLRKQKDRNASRKTGTQLRTLATSQPDIKPTKDYAELDRWFKDRRKEMQNVCCECGKGTNVHSEKYFKWSICHIAPKALVPSVATDLNNWIELCWLHHQELDSTFDKAAAMQCFPEIKQKFQLFKNKIPPQELRKVNPHLLTT